MFTRLRLRPLRYILTASALALSLLLIVSQALRPVQAAHQSTTSTFIVNSPSDVVDANPGDGKCETAPGDGVCTLRAAIMEANHTPGGATIHFELPGTVTYLLTIPKSGTDDEATGDLNITNTLTLIGNGAGRTIIDGNGSVLGDNVLEITGTVVISGVTIQHGASLSLGASRGGGIYHYGGALTLINSAILSNTVDGPNAYGGGILSYDALTLTHSLVRGNRTGSINASGGGIYSGGKLTLSDSIVSSNTTSGSIGSGGGILVGNTATIVGSTIDRNSAQYGGGLFNYNNTSLVIINSTVSGNQSATHGGGLYNNSGTTSLYNATFTDNLANADASNNGLGGGVFNAINATFNFQNSLIAGNNHIVSAEQPVLNPDDCSGTITSQGNNLLQSMSDCTVNGGGVTVADPKLGPLSNNGGSTQTQVPLTGSPAIDAGNAGGCTDNLGALLTIDQRGFHRPIGLRCDIGAVEVGPYVYLPLIQR